MASYEAKNEIYKQCLVVVGLYAWTAVGKALHLGMQITEFVDWHRSSKLCFVYEICIFLVLPRLLSQTKTVIWVPL